jgi:hypothetical protein
MSKESMTQATPKEVAVKKEAPLPAQFNLGRTSRTR